MSIHKRPAKAETLSAAKLAAIVNEVQMMLWYDRDARRWDKDKEWDSDGICEDLDVLLSRNGLGIEDDRES